MFSPFKFIPCFDFYRIGNVYSQEVSTAASGSTSSASQVRARSEEFEILGPKKLRRNQEAQGGGDEDDYLEDVYGEDEPGPMTPKHAETYSVNDSLAHVVQSEENFNKAGRNPLYGMTTATIEMFVIYGKRAAAHELRDAYKAKFEREETVHLRLPPKDPDANTSLKANALAAMYWQESHAAAKGGYLRQWRLEKYLVWLGDELMEFPVGLMSSTRSGPFNEGALPQSVVDRR